MSQVKTGTVTVTSSGVQQNLNLGFIPDKFYMRNDTILTSGTVTGVVEVWYDSYTAGLTTPYVVINTCNAGVPAISRLASGTVASCTGIVSYTTADSNLYVPNQAPYTTTTGSRQYIGASTNQVISKTASAITQAANALVTTAQAHSFTASDIGVTVVTFHGVPGMTQINGMSGVIQSVPTTTTFTVNINTSNFSAYSTTNTTEGVNSGFFNVITGAPVNTIYGNQSLPTSEQNLGFTGLILGTSVMVNTSDVWYYEAILNYPGIA